MTYPDGDNGAPDRGRRASLADRAWGWVVDGLAAVGTVLICVLMGIICADIVARNAMGASLPLISELGALVVVMIVALQLATTVRAGRLARTEILAAWLESRFPRAGEVLNGVFALAGAGLIGLAAWATVDVVLDDFEAGEFIGVTGIATLPTWPFRALILLGFTVAALEFLREAVTRFWRALRTEQGA